MGSVCTFLFQDDGHHIGVVVSDGHVERALEGDALAAFPALGHSALGLQVGVGPLLEQLGSQAGKATATGCVEWSLTLRQEKEDKNPPGFSQAVGHMQDKIHTLLVYTAQSEPRFTLVLIWEMSS